MYFGMLCEFYFGRNLLQARSNARISKFEIGFSLISTYKRLCEFLKGVDRVNTTFQGQDGISNAIWMTFITE